MERGNIQKQKNICLKKLISVVIFFLNMAHTVN
jgi:hypothetical protein